MPAVWGPGPVVLPQVCLCVHIPVQAKDSDDDDDVTVTVDRDRFMDEFFEQVGASTPSLSPYTGRPWVTNLSSEPGPVLTHLFLAQQPLGTS